MPDRCITTGGGKTKGSPSDGEATLPADMKQTQAVCQALDPFARRLTRSIRLSIVKPFRRGLRVSHWSLILTHRGQRSVCGAHLHVISTHQILLKSITCGTNSTGKQHSNPHTFSYVTFRKSASVIIYKSRPSSPLPSELLTLLGSRSGQWQVEEEVSNVVFMREGLYSMQT